MPETQVARTVVRLSTETIATTTAIAVATMVISTSAQIQDQIPLPPTSTQGRAHRRLVADTTKGVRLHRQQVDGVLRVVRDITKVLRRIMGTAIRRDMLLLPRRPQVKVMRRPVGMLGLRRRLLLMVVGGKGDWEIADIVLILYDLNLGIIIDYQELHHGMAVVAMRHVGSLDCCCLVAIECDLVLNHL